MGLRIELVDYILLLLFIREFSYLNSKKMKNSIDYGRKIFPKLIAQIGQHDQHLMLNLINFSD